MTLDGSGGKTIAVVLYPGLTALDLVGPLRVLTELERFAPRYRTVVVGASTEPMATDLPLRLVADATFADVPQPDVLVVPGGRNGTIRAMSDPGVRGYVRGAAASADVVGSVCTGSLILGAVGLLRGREATTHWFFAARSSSSARPTPGGGGSRTTPCPCRPASRRASTGRCTWWPASPTRPPPVGCS